MPLTIVHSPAGTTANCTLDIVAVHGLNGDEKKTWTHGKSSAFWLQDFLPRKIENARVLTFGYDATAMFGQSTSGLLDHAKGLLVGLKDKRESEDERERPIIFIAHSLGGIVVKTALLQARLISSYNSIDRATLGIMFFGTPHRGSSIAAYGSRMATVARKLSNQPSNSLLKALQANSPELLNLTDQFRHQQSQYKIVSFYEQRCVQGLSILIVDSYSARLDWPEEEQIPVAADHIEMCKFEKEDDDTFDKTWRRIRSIRDSTQPASTHPASISPPLNLSQRVFELGLNGEHDRLRELIARGADVDARDENGGTLLHHAADNGDTGLARLVLQCHADVNARNKWQEPPLRHAVLKRDLETVKVLIGFGANPTASDVWGETPLLMATRGVLPENRDITRLLER